MCFSKPYIAILLILGLSFQGIAQVQLDTTQSIEYMVEKILLGDGVVVGNIKFQGSSYSLASFTDHSENFSIKDGILLSTGNVYYSKGPNNQFHAGWASNQKGDESLDQLANGETRDAAILEFDFITASENIAFNFIFASEEYNEYVGSQFNDVFGFFVSGPNKPLENIAIIPETTTPITVNTVNSEQNNHFFVDNSFENTTDRFIWDVREKKVIENPNFLLDLPLPKYNIQFDGFTTVLTARTTVIPNQIYHIKIAIADVADGILDSGVFLEAGTFHSYGKQLVKINNKFSRSTVPKRGVEPEPIASEIEIKELPESTLSSKDSLLINRILNVEFEFDSYSFSETSKDIINDVFSILKKNPDSFIEINGHTDNVGTEHYNFLLSERRARAVSVYLEELGLHKSRIKTTYFGEKSPIKTNTNENGRSKNRRVEFVVRISD